MRWKFRVINKNEIERDVLRLIQLKHQHAQAKAEEHLMSAMESVNYKNAYNAVRRLEFDIAKAQFHNQDVKTLKQELEKQKETLKLELKKTGLKQTDLAPDFECKICNDTGFKDNQKCSCYKKLLSEKLLLYSGINSSALPKFSDVNFAIFDSAIIGEMKSLYEKMEQYTNNLATTSKKVITLIGKTGVGKTYLTECMVENAIAHSNYTVYVSAFSLNEDMLKYHLASIYDKNAIINKYLHCDFLVIDDLGTEPRLNNVTEEYLYLIVNERLTKNKNTLITTNLGLKQIQDVYGDRIFSRIANQYKCVLINMQGQDLRIKKDS